MLSCFAHALCVSVSDGVAVEREVSRRLPEAPGLLGTLMVGFSRLAEQCRLDPLLGVQFVGSHRREQPCQQPE
jgi:hypothetical protein